MRLLFENVSHKEDKRQFELNPVTLKQKADLLLSRLAKEGHVVEQSH